MMDITKYLSHVFLFESVSPEQIDFFKSFISLKKVSRGEHIFSEGQTATAFFIVVQGTVKLYKLSADGNEHILHVQKSGELLAEAVIFDFETYPAYCQAVEDTQLLRISKIEFKELLRHFPEISFQIMNAYSRRLRQMVNIIEDLSLRDIKSRLAKLLIEHSVIENNHHIYHLTLSKKDLASLLGTIPETLSRTLHNFKKKNLIHEENNQIILLDVKKLKTYM